MRFFSVFVRAALVSGVLASVFAISVEAWAQAKPAAEKAPEPPPLPPASARLWLIAPTTPGPWTMRVENEGSVAVRIPADGRLLRLEIQTDEETKPVSCVLPSSLRPKNFPEDRALILAPGHSYVETFDPYLFCFGKSAVTLGPNMVVHARFGWEPPKAPKIKPKKPKPPTGPFAVESAEREPTISPLWELQAPSIVLGATTAPPPAAAAPVEKPAEAAVESGEKDSPDKPNEKETTDKPAENTGVWGAERRRRPEAPNVQTGTDKPVEKDKPPTANVPAVDERAGKLELSSASFVEASAPRSIALNVTAKNVGLRPINVALRPWMLSFRIDGPGLEPQMCYADHSRRVLPRDAYRPLAAGASSSFSVLLAEVCPKNVFPKPGLYRVTAMMAAKETTDGVEIRTISLRGKETSFVRLTGADEPFYSEPPKATPQIVVNMDEE